MTASHAELIPVLQAAVAPVILISGVGLLLLSMTNRYARVIDRARALAREHAAGGAEAARRHAGEQAAVIWKRAKLLRTAIVLATACIFGVAVTVVSIFLGQLLALDVGPLVALVFLASLLALVGSLAYLIRDFALSLQALKLELATIDPKFNE